MGAHWAWLGFADVDALVAEARKGAAGQARLMARFIEKSGLKEALRSRDWEAFARGYNGPGFRQNAYHTKLAAAYRRLRRDGWKAGRSRRQAGGPPPLLGRRIGGRGRARPPAEPRRRSAIRSRSDGIFGKDTEEAVRAFQRDHGLGADGMVGPKTLAAIGKALPFGAMWRRLWRWASDGLGVGNALSTCRFWMTPTPNPSPQGRGTSAVRPFIDSSSLVLLTG